MPVIPLRKRPARSHTPPFPTAMLYLPEGHAPHTIALPETAAPSAHVGLTSARRPEGSTRHDQPALLNLQKGAQQLFARAFVYVPRRAPFWSDFLRPLY